MGHAPEMNTATMVPSVDCVNSSPRLLAKAEQDMATKTNRTHEINLSWYTLNDITLVMFGNDHRAMILAIVAAGETAADILHTWANVGATHTDFSSTNRCRRRIPKSCIAVMQRTGRDMAAAHHSTHSFASYAGARQVRFHGQTVLSSAGPLRVRRHAREEGLGTVGLGDGSRIITARRTRRRRSCARPIPILATDR
jgi:hypothetical protein